MNRIVLMLFIIGASNFCIAQGLKEKICGKKWYPDKYRETDGKVYPLDNDTKLLYTKFNCDGTFESWEAKGVLIKGTWLYDEKSKTIKMETKNKKVPMDESVSITSCDGKKLAFVKTDGGGEKITIYSIAK